MRRPRSDGRAACRVSSEACAPPPPLEQEQSRWTRRTASRPERRPAGGSRPEPDQRPPAGHRFRFSGAEKRKNKPSSDEKPADSHLKQSFCQHDDPRDAGSRRCVINCARRPARAARAVARPVLAGQQARPVMAGEALNSAAQPLESPDL